MLRVVPKMNDTVVVVFLHAFRLQCHLISRDTLQSLNAMDLLLKQYVEVHIKYIMLSTEI